MAEHQKPKLPNFLFRQLCYSGNLFIRNINQPLRNGKLFFGTLPERRRVADKQGGHAVQFKAVLNDSRNNE